MPSQGSHQDVGMRAGQSRMMLVPLPGATTSRDFPPNSSLILAAIARSIPRRSAAEPQSRSKTLGLSSIDSTEEGGCRSTATSVIQRSEAPRRVIRIGAPAEAVDALANAYLKA